LEALKRKSSETPAPLNDPPQSKQTKIISRKSIESDEEDIMALLDEIDNIDSAIPTLASNQPKPIPKILVADSGQRAQNNAPSCFPQMAQAPTSQLIAAPAPNIPSLPFPFTPETFTNDIFINNVNALRKSEMHQFKSISEIMELDKFSKIPWACLMVKDFTFFGSDAHVTLMDHTGTMI